MNISTWGLKHLWGILTIKKAKEGLNCQYLDKISHFLSNLNASSKINIWYLDYMLSTLVGKSPQAST